MASIDKVDNFNDEVNLIITLTLFEEYIIQGNILDPGHENKLSSGATLCLSQECLNCIIIIILCASNIRHKTTTHETMGSMVVSISGSTSIPDTTGEVL